MKSANLAIVFVDIAGFTERTGRQSREQSEQWLRKFEQLIMPLIRALGGRRIKTIGDAYLCTFCSPTNALLFGMATQDRLHEYNTTVDDDGRFSVRVALSAGEIRIKNGDVYGEPVNIAARIEAITPAGEIWFSEAAYLAMTKSEVPSEKVGTKKLKGIAEEVKIYRIPRDSGYRLSADPDLTKTQTDQDKPLHDKLPFGGLGLKKAEQSGWAVNIGTGPQLLVHTGRGVAKNLLSVPVWIWIALSGVILVAVLIAWLYASGPLSQCLSAVNDDQFSKAQLILDADKNRFTPLGKAIQARIWLRQSQKLGEATKLIHDAIEAQPALLADDEVVKDLVLSLNRRNAKSTINLLATRVGAKALDPLLNATKDRRYWIRWNAIEALKQIGSVDKVDLSQVYILDLTYSGSCSVRKKAAKKLAKLKDKRALGPLRAAQKRNFFKNICMGDTLQNAIKAIEK